MRRIIYLSGTRADYGLLRLCLVRLHKDPSVDLQLCITGSHLDAQSGYTVSEVESDGLNIVARIPVGGHQATGAEMGRAFGTVATSMAQILDQHRPDILLLLGDRYEMLAAASVAVTMNIPIAHIHGGERSGTVDENFRHAITKLSHFHLVATESAAERIRKMGEDPSRIHLVGAPGLDELSLIDFANRDEICKTFKLAPDAKYAVIVFHSVVQELDSVTEQISGVIQAVEARFDQAVVIGANTDPGGGAVNAFLRTQLPPNFRLFFHVPRRQYLSLLRHASVLVGNSSSGIIEAASLGTPVVDVGTRQMLRERNANVINASVSVDEIEDAIDACLCSKVVDSLNVYGDGRAGERIHSFLKSVDLDRDVLTKSNAY